MAFTYIFLIVAVAVTQLTTTLSLPALGAQAAKEIEDISGFLLFRHAADGKFEFLLLEKADEPGDWSPPKGHVEKGESGLDAAYRELREETTLLKDNVQPLLQYSQYFEYETNKDVLKRVTLWPAELLDLDHPIVISDESRAYTWVETSGAVEMIKYQYRLAFFKLVQNLDCHFNLSTC